MTTIIKIPAGYVLENQSKPLDLFPQARCSRCDAQPAARYETHLLKYEAGVVQNRRLSKNFRTSARVHLRLPVCENCYSANFIENPDSCTSDENKIGRIAKARKLGINIGSVFAGIAFILLMKLFPLPQEIPWLQYLWMILITTAMLIYGITFGLVELENRGLRSRLQEKNYNFSLRRAEVFAVKQVEDPQPEDVAVTVALKNESWAEECANHYGWSFDKI